VAPPPHSTATFTTAYDGSGGIVVALATGGAGYVTAPTITVAGGAGSGCSATCTLLGGVVNAVIMGSHGTSYTTATGVTATDLTGPPTPTTATATATVAGGQVISIAVNLNGAYYYAAPAVTIPAPP